MFKKKKQGASDVIVKFTGYLTQRTLLLKTLRLSDLNLATTL